MRIVTAGLLVIGIAIVGVGAWFIAARAGQEAVTAAESPRPSTVPSEVAAARAITGSAESQQQTKTTDANAAPPTTPAAESPRSALGDGIGTVQPVPADTNAQVASVASALRDKTHPERLSPLIAPPPFDAAAFTANPDAYINVVQPGRVFQTAEPDAVTPVLRPLSATQLSMRQDDSVILRAVTAPNAPVTFTSFDLGRFGNQLASQTVVADAQGVASVSFTPGPGTIDDVHILAGSPLASGQVTFDISVTSAQVANTSIPALPVASVGSGADK